jgi:hypothetical protein
MAIVQKPGLALLLMRAEETLDLHAGQIGARRRKTSRPTQEVFIWLIRQRFDMSKTRTVRGHQCWFEF